MATEDERRVVVKNGKDSLDICRVVNGMWQTSGGWGRIERDSAVDAMLKYADCGLATFDMADICKTPLRKKKIDIYILSALLRRFDYQKKILLDRLDCLVNFKDKCDCNAPCRPLTQ